MKHIVKVIVLEQKNNIGVIKEVILQSKYGKNSYIGAEIGTWTEQNRIVQFVEEVSFRLGALNVE